MSARGQPRPPIVPGQAPPPVPAPAGRAAGAPAPLCHPLLHVTPRSPLPAAPPAAGSLPSHLGPREKSSACREVALSLSTPPPGLGKLGRETAFLATSLSSPFNYSGTGWRRWGCRKANCWEGWGGEPDAFPPTGPTTSLCTLPCSAELAGLSFPEFQMTAALVGSNLAI